MRRSLLPAILLLASLPPVLASPKKGDGSDSVAQLLVAADANGNRKIDGDEHAALRQAFKSGGSSGPLQKYDLNHDGVLDDVEIEAIKFPAPKKGLKGSKANPLFGPRLSSLSPL